MLCMSKTSKMYIKGVLRYINTRDQSNVEGVEDRSNTPKGCNDVCRRHKMYIKGVLRYKIQEIKAMSKVSKIYQIHLRAVMLCMSKIEDVIKGVLRYINTRDQSNVEGVEDRSNYT